MFLSSEKEKKTIPVTLKVGAATTFCGRQYSALHLWLVSLRWWINVNVFISFDVMCCWPLFLCLLPSRCYNLIGWLHVSFRFAFVCLFILCRGVAKQQRAIKTVAVAISVAPIKPIYLEMKSLMCCRLTAGCAVRVHNILPHGRFLFKVTRRAQHGEYGCERVCVCVSERVFGCKAHTASGGEPMALHGSAHV